MRHLIWALLIIGCGGDSFSATEREATSDGGLGDKPAVRVTGDDAGSVEGSGGGSGDAAVGSPEDGGGSGLDGAAGFDGSGANDSGGPPDADGSPGLDGGVTCTTGEGRCSDRQPQVCISDFWLDNGSTCSSNEPPFRDCLNGACVECSPGRSSCTSNGTNGVNWPQTCDATGSWVVDTECSGATPLCRGGTCTTCEDVALISACSDGQFVCCDTAASQPRCRDECGTPTP